MSNRIAYAYSEITGMFTDYIAGVDVKPTITIHGFGDLEMFNNLVYQDLLKNHYQENTLELLQKRIYQNLKMIVKKSLSIVLHQMGKYVLMRNTAKIFFLA